MPNMKSYLKHTFIYDAYMNRKLRAFNKQVQELFPQNELHPKTFFPIEILEAGKYSYGDLNIVTFDNKSHLKIGNFVSIAQNVTFLLDAEHSIDTISTFPFKAKVLKEAQPEATSKGDIIIDDDAWIGYGAMVLSGVHIGQGAVVAAGALVTHDVPPYSVVGGVPAKVIKMRFNNDMVQKLLQIDYSSLDLETIQKHIKELEEPLKDESQLKWLIDNQRKKSK